MCVHCLKVFKSPREELQLQKPMSTEEELMSLKMPHFNIFSTTSIKD